ncbi:MAG: ABC transporter transmembrane domain-containing protein [Alphaproteobacteria bacterium]|nr:ABC transporter transmembrane domain-containing protein [Alphaproteobacteria bacterium]
MRERTAEETDDFRAEAEARRRSKSFAPLRNLLTYLAPYKLQIFLAMVSLVLAAATVLGIGAGLRILVDDAFSGDDPALLDQAVLILLGIIVLMAVTSWARFYLVSWIGERVVADLRQAVFRHVLTLSPAYFETAKIGEVSSRITTDTTLIQVVVGSSVSIALRNLLLLIGGMTMLIITSWELTGLVLLVVPLVLVPIIFYGRKVRRLSRASQDRVADVSVQVDESLSAIRTVQAFNRQATDGDHFADRAETAFDAAVARVKARAFLTASVIVLVFSAVSAILWLGGREVIAGTISAGELSAFVFYAAVVAAGTGAISEVIGDLQRAAGATERLMELLSTPSEIAAPAHPIALPKPVTGTIAFDAVRFHYPSRPDFAALNEISFEVAAGERVAVVGPSGAGKSTLFQLILRFYDPEAGAIRFDGVDLRAADPAAIRSKIGLVPQEPVIFSTTIEDNIGYGRRDASALEIREAAKAANALEFIDDLPEGMKTFVGEKGVRLSGGQRQRIAIARAILKDPALLLLDEATSALDAENERLVQAALDDLMEDRTSLVIAHRLATVQSADRILVLDKGTLVETGTHDDLVAAGGLYASLAALQFSQ